MDSGKPEREHPAKDRIDMLTPLVFVVSLGLFWASWTLCNWSVAKSEEQYEKDRNTP